MYCSREYQLTSRFIQQYEKSTSKTGVCLSMPSCLKSDREANINAPQPQIRLGTFANNAESQIRLDAFMNALSLISDLSWGHS